MFVLSLLVSGNRQPVSVFSNIEDLEKCCKQHYLSEGHDDNGLFMREVVTGRMYCVGNATQHNHEYFVDQVKSYD